MNSEEAAPEGGWRFMKVATGSGRDAISDWLSDVPIGERKGVRAYLVSLHSVICGSYRGHRGRGRSSIGFRGRSIPASEKYGLSLEMSPIGHWGALVPEPDQFTRRIGCRNSRGRKRQDEMETAISAGHRCA